MVPFPKSFARPKLCLEGPSVHQAALPFQFNRSQNSHELNTMTFKSKGLPQRNVTLANVLLNLILHPKIMAFVGGANASFVQGRRTR